MVMEERAPEKVEGERVTEAGELYKAPSGVIYSRRPWRKTWARACLFT
jgi:hypothetical protein